VQNILGEVKEKRKQDIPDDERVHIDPAFENLIVNSDTFGLNKEEKVGKFLKVGRKWKPTRQRKTFRATPDLLLTDIWMFFGLLVRELKFSSLAPLCP
jgi:hypothetical protein